MTSSIGLMEPGDKFRVTQFLLVLSPSGGNRNRTRCVTAVHRVGVEYEYRLR